MINNPKWRKIKRVDNRKPAQVISSNSIRILVQSVVGLETFEDLKIYLKKFPNVLTRTAVVKISRNHDKLMKGFDLDIQTPFAFLIPSYFGHKVDLIDRREFCLKVVDDLLSKCPVFESSSEFRAFELENRAKCGNTSTILPFTHPFGLLRNVAGYFEADVSKNLPYSRSAFNYAKSKVRDLIPSKSLSMVMLQSVIDDCEKSTNWGAPFWEKGNFVMDDGRQCFEHHYDLAASMLESGKIDLLPSVLVNRTMPNGTQAPKQRAAFACPHALVLLELCLQRPIMGQLTNHPYFSEWVNKDRTDMRITDMFAAISNSDCKLISFDASRFDQTIGSLFLDAVYDIFGDWFGDDNLWVIQSLRTFMSDHDLITPVGVFTGRSKAVASGSGLTNLVDSLVQNIAFHYCSFMVGAPVETTDGLFNGDDGVWVIPGLTPTLLALYCGQLGLEVNPDKSAYSDNYATFCQRLYLNEWRRDGICIGIRSSYKTMNSLICRERMAGVDWNPAMDSVRAIMQLENCSGNPIYDELVTLMVGADSKYGLGLKHPNGIKGLFSQAGTRDKIIKQLGNSSWERDRIKNQLLGIYTLRTIQLLERTPLRGD